MAHLVIIEKDIDRLDYYISRGISFEVLNIYGHSLFMMTIVHFDDFDLLDHLLDCGNSPLINILSSAEFKRDKFNYLPEIRCDINLQNSYREFPIGVCIMYKFDVIGHILLDKGCQINDDKSLYEHITNALRIGSQHWFETLIKKGVNALNTVFPVLVNYFRSCFYTFTF